MTDDEKLAAATKIIADVEATLRAFEVMNVAGWTADQWASHKKVEAELVAKRAGAKMAVNIITQRMAAEVAKALT